MTEICNIENISKSYNNRLILDNISLKLIRGHSYVICGESGIGKTTLLNIIAGYVSADSGIINKVGKIDYMLQDKMLFSNLTVKQNIEIKLAAINDKQITDDLNITEELKRVNIHNLIDQKINTLSGGERQRVELIMKSLVSPDILLLDEPTSELDKNNKEKVINIIDTLFENTTKVVVTHDEESYPKSYKRLVMRNGVLIDECNK